MGTRTPTRFIGPVTAFDIDPGLPWIHRDFLASNVRADWIIGNPPFTGAEAHVEHALAHAHIGVAFLLRLAFLASAKRMKLFRAHPPEFVWILPERPSFSGGGTDSTDYAIFIWRRGFAGTPQLDWLPWKGTS